MWQNSKQKKQTLKYFEKDDDCGKLSTWTWLGLKEQNHNTEENKLKNKPKGAVFTGCPPLRKDNPFLAVFPPNVIKQQQKKNLSGSKHFNVAIM